MNPLRTTLLADGSSDQCLVPIIGWVLARFPEVTGGGFQTQFADPNVLGRPDGGLGGRMQAALRLYPCDVLFVHRDAEREPKEHRLEEIRNAVDAAAARNVVPVVPVRMTEAWLLFEELAIRRAADNPNGRVRLALPRLREVESIPDPKQTLSDLLVLASEKAGRRLDHFRRDISHRRLRVASLITDFSPLQQLSAFQEFLFATGQVLTEWQDQR